MSLPHLQRNLNTPRQLQAVDYPELFHHVLDSTHNVLREHMPTVGRMTVCDNECSHSSELGRNDRRDSGLQFTNHQIDDILFEWLMVIGAAEVVVEVHIAMTVPSQNVTFTLCRIRLDLGNYLRPVTVTDVNV